MLLGTEAKSRRTPSPAEGKRKGRSEPKTTLTLPYISGLSEAIRRVLTPLGVKVVFRPLWTLHQMLVRLKEPVPVKEHKGVVCTIPCVECSSVYISQTGRSLKQRVNKTPTCTKESALAGHVFKTGHAGARPSPACQHTLHVGELEHQGQLTRQSWTGSEEPYWRCTQCSWTDGHIPTYHLVFLLHIVFVSAVNNLAQQWCTWDHVTCMCIGTPSWSTPGLIGHAGTYSVYKLKYILYYRWNGACMPVWIHLGGACKSSFDGQQIEALL